MTRSKGNAEWTFVICCASSYCGLSPVPLSPMAANFSESDLLGSGEDCAKSAADADRGSEEKNGEETTFRRCHKHDLDDTRCSTMLPV